jgi:uncharacterized protein (UPF0147 family)
MAKLEIIITPMTKTPMELRNTSLVILAELLADPTLPVEARKKVTDLHSSLLSVMSNLKLPKVRNGA